MRKLALVTAPFFLSNLHRSLAGSLIASLNSRYAVDRIAIINGVRSDDDREWLGQRFDVVEDNTANILARAWNRGLRVAFERGADYAIVSNLDVVFHPLCIDNLVACAEEHPEALVWSTVPWHNPRTFAHARQQPTVRPGLNWSCFMVARDFFDKVGEFDEGFTPAYLEDTDMTYRLRLCGGTYLSCLSALCLNFDRGTIKGVTDCEIAELPRMAEFLKELRIRITANDARYAEKWGGGPGSERFVVPFDGKNTPESTEHPETTQ